MDELAREARETRRQERNDRMEAGAQLLALKEELQSLRIYVEQRLDHQKVWIASNQASGMQNARAIERIDKIVIKQLIPTIRDLSGQIKSLAEESKLTRQAYMAQNTTIALQAEALTSISTQYQKDFAEQKKALIDHKEAESWLTKAGVMVGGLWLTTIGLVVLFLTEYIVPGLKHLITIFFSKP